MKKIALSISFLLIFLEYSTILLSQSPVWVQAVAGVWKTSVGSPDKLDFFNSAGIVPDITGLSRLGTAGFPLSEKDISAEIINGQTYLRFPLERNEQIFGFGLNFKTVYQRGRILQLHVDHYGGIIPMMPPVLHAPAAGKALSG
jgi:alpha-D-xyloside xylohydrolase